MNDLDIGAHIHVSTFTHMYIRIITNVHTFMQVCAYLLLQNDLN